MEFSLAFTMEFIIALRLYEYKINELKKKKMVAITDITVKLLRIMFTLVKNKSMYDSRLVLQAKSIEVDGYYSGY